MDSFVSNANTHCHYHGNSFSPPPYAKRKKIAGFGSLGLLLCPGSGCHSAGRRLAALLQSFSKSLNQRAGNKDFFVLAVALQQAFTQYF
jgi:hypothetical protein